MSVVSTDERKKLVREHSSQILAAKSSERMRANFLGDSEFLCLPTFQNNLPSVPCGPFFKTIPLKHSFDSIAVYNMSSLEKSYVWQPHLSVDVGLNMDLVDQDIILNSNRVPVDKEDAAFLNTTTDRSRGSKEPNKKISWLKKTTYTSNELSSNARRYADDVNVKRVKLNDDVDTIHLPPHEIVEKSFQLASKISKQSIEASRKRAVEWVMPIVPNLDMWPQLVIQVNYAEDTLKYDDSNKYKSSQISNSFLTVRKLEIKKEEELKLKTASAVSLFFPDSNLQGDEEEEEEDIFSSDTGKKHTWVRDYRMDISSDGVKDLYVLSFPEHVSPQDSSSAVCTYVPLRSRIKIGKYKSTRNVKDTLTVVRRELTEDELQLKKDALSEVGGVK